MKRLLVVAVLAFALAAPTVAIAFEPRGALDSPTKAARPFKFAFNVRFDGGEPVKVKDFRFRNLRMDCDQGRVLLKASGFPHMPVSNDEFGDTFSNPDHSIMIDGKFNNRATKVEGTVQADGDFAADGGGEFTNCFGSKNYTAKEI